MRVELSNAASPRNIDLNERQHPELSEDSSRSLEQIGHRIAVDVGRDERIEFQVLRFG